MIGFRTRAKGIPPSPPPPHRASAEPLIREFASFAITGQREEGRKGTNKGDRERDRQGKVGRHATFLSGFPVMRGVGHPSKAELVPLFLGSLILLVLKTEVPLTSALCIFEPTSLLIANIEHAPLSKR